ncbi:MAG TPA: hypothetical protein VGK16_09485 [Candidatus Limnocylindrales bacterium]
MTRRLLVASGLAVALAACGSPASDTATGAASPVAPSASAAASSALMSSLEPASPTATPRPAVFPGESWIAFQSDTGGGTYGVRLVRPDGTGLFFPTNTAEGTEQLHPDWSPDGTKLVFSTLGAAARDLWVTDADGGNADHIVACDVCSLADEPAWSPDGTQIAYHAHRLEDDWVSTLEIYDVGTRTSRVVWTAPSDHAVYAMRWSPDGTRLVAEYVHRRNGTKDLDDFDSGALVIFDLTAAKPRPTVITDDSYWPANPDWSPDGSRIVFFRPVDPERFDAEADLWTIKPDGSGLTRLTHYADDHAFAVQATYTPDGARIAFVTAKVGSDDPWVMATVAADGSDPQPATSNGYIAGVHPRFRPTP